MVWLASNERYGKFGHFDPASGALKECQLVSSANDARKSTHGHYSKLGDRFLAIYGLAGKLFLAIDARVIEIGVDDVIEVSGPRSARVLRVLDERREVCLEVNYCLDGVPGPIPNDPTPFVAEEHFDIGLLASNISRNTVRRVLCTDKPSEDTEVMVQARRDAMPTILASMTPSSSTREIRRRNRRAYGDELGPTLQWLRSVAGMGWGEIAENVLDPDGQDLEC